MASRELEYRDTLAAPAEPKRVVVIGGGVAGMSAALTAARRGHEVHLLERGGELGGQLLLAHLPPHREELESALHYFRRSVAEAGVHVELGQHCKGDVSRLSPDHVIVSTGAVSRLPDVPGAALPHVAFGWEIISGRREAGDTCAVIGGGLVGIEVADFLAHRGRQVVIVARSGLLSKAVRADTVYFLDRIEALGIEVMTHTALLAIGPDWLEVQPRGRLRRTLTGIDTVIVCAGYEPDRQMADALAAAGTSVQMAGDVLGSRKFFQAVEEGTLAALQL